MDDTSDEVKEILRKRYAALTGLERWNLGFASCSAARQIVLASLPKGLSQIEIKIQLFLRYYGNDFTKIEKEKIITHIKNLPN